MVVGGLSARISAATHCATHSTALSTVMLTLTPGGLSTATKSSDEAMRRAPVDRGCGGEALRVDVDATVRAGSEEKVGIAHATGAKMPRVAVQNPRGWRLGVVHGAERDQLANGGLVHAGLAGDEPREDGRGGAACVGT